MDIEQPGFRGAVRRFTAEVVNAWRFVFKNGPTTEEAEPAETVADVTATPALTPDEELARAAREREEHYRLHPNQF